MLDSDVIRAWKDARYRSTLSPIDRAAIPSHPSGEILALIQPLEALGPGPFPDPFCSVLCMTYEVCAESTITTTTTTNIVN